MKRNYSQIPAVLKKVLDQAQMREDLRLTKERLEYLVSASPAVIYSARVPGFGVTFMSPNVEKQLGYSPADFLADSAFWVDRIHPEDRERVLGEAERFVQMGSGTIEYRFQHKDGSYRWTRDEFRAASDESGKPSEIVGYWIDITGRRQAEEMRERLRVIVEVSPDGIAMTKQHVFYMNTAARRLLGIAPEDDVTRLRLLDFHPEEMRAFVTEVVLPAAERDGVWRGETVFVSQGGERIPVSQAVVAHKGAGGKVEFFSTIVRDIREQKALEDRLRHAQKMEAVGRLAGGVAHDFNNILTVVLGYAGLLLPQVRKTDPLRESIEHIETAGRRGAALTRQLLAVSRRQPMRFRIVDLNGVVKQMHPMLRRLIGEDITLAVDMDAAPTLATVDPNQIEQVILNLAVNARDAMPRGGQITISTRNAPAAGTANGARVRLTVSDTGMGIPPEILEKIFEPFFSTKGEKGTGLGLATVYGIIQQSGGDIRVQTAPEKGTAFEIDLPAAAMQAAAAEPEAPAAPPVGSGVILLVEDEDPVRAVTANILRSRGFQVVECRNAGEALLICERSDQPIDLMLTDIVMPLMSGPQLAERITALRPALRILYMSGYTDDATSRHGMHGGIDFIEKPFTADSLVSKIVSVLG